jgi:hypothetical protein
VPSRRQRQRGIGRVDIGPPGRPEGQPAHRHRAEYRGQHALVATPDPPSPFHSPRLAFGGQRLLLPQRAQAGVVLGQLPLKLAAPGPGQLLRLIVGHLLDPAAG